MNDETLSFLLDRNEGPSTGASTSASESSPTKKVTADPLMLDFGLLNGERLAFPYRTLFNVALNPSRGIIVTFSTHTVTISGVYLRSVYESIKTQEADCLEAVGTRPQRLVEGVCVIFLITAEERT